MAEIVMKAPVLDVVLTSGVDATAGTLSVAHLATEASRSCRRPDSATINLRKLLRAANNAAIISIVATPDSHPDCRAAAARGAVNAAPRS
jgi:hypothetical protein